MKKEESFICHWPRCVLWWCSVTKIGYEVKKMISLQDFPFSCNKFLFGWGKKKKLCKVKKSWSCSAEQFCDLHMTCAVLVWKDDESGFVEFWFFFHHLLLNTKCNVYSIQKYFNKISFFHFFFYHLLIFYLINYWIKKCYVLYMSLYY